MDNQNIENFDELQKNELDDIVLKKYEKKEKIKKYALIGGSIILVFIIVISIMKLLNDSSTIPQDRLVDNQEFSQENIKIDEEPNFEEIPIEEESKSEEILQNVAKEVIEKQKSLQQSTQHAPQTRKNFLQKSNNKQKVEPSTPAQTKKQKISQQTPMQTKKQKISQQTPIQTQKKKELKSTPKKTTHKEAKTIKTISKKNLYIQVGAFLKYAPDKKFLQKIKRAGFNYIIKTFHIKGKKITRVYIGPFSSKAKAREALFKAKRKISKNAFITRVR